MSCETFDAKQCSCTDSWKDCHKMLTVKELVGSVRNTSSACAELVKHLGLAATLYVSVVRIYGRCSQCSHVQEEKVQCWWCRFLSTFYRTRTHGARPFSRPANVVAACWPARYAAEPTELTYNLRLKRQTQLVDVSIYLSVLRGLRTCSLASCA